MQHYNAPRPTGLNLCSNHCSRVFVAGSRAARPSRPSVQFVEMAPIFVVLGVVNGSSNKKQSNKAKGTGKKSRRATGTTSSSKDGCCKKTPGYAGLKNFGNTCFMNATLQALINTREFRDFFLEKYYLRDINGTNPLGSKGRLAEEFGQFVSEMWNGINLCLLKPCLLKKLERIKKLVSLKAPEFDNSAQQDAQEFLSFLLDGLHEDLNRVDKKPLTPTVESDGRPDAVVADEAWQCHKMREDSIVVDLFHGQLKSSLECLTCGHTSTTFDSFVYLAVPFPKSCQHFPFYADSEKQPLQLSELFEIFTETETLSTSETWYCSRCRDHRQAKKTLSILPSILIVQLKRFVFTSKRVWNKIYKHVVYPIRDLDVRPYMPKDAANNDVTTIYDLYAVVCHSGTLSFGHYTGFARLPRLEDPTETDVDWRCFDDKNVTRVLRENQLVNPNAYFLFYKKRDCSSTDLFDRYEGDQPEGTDDILNLLPA